MVLPRISTNISVYDTEPEANPLPLYLESISAMRALPADTLVLPSHGKPFSGLHRRIDQLLRHHEERCAEVLQACTEAPRSAADLLPVLFKRELDLHQTTFALGEAVAHVHALLSAGRLREGGAATACCATPRPERRRRGRVETRRHLAVAQRQARALVVGQHRAHHVPEGRAVVHLAQVRQFVGHHVVDDRQAEMHQRQFSRIEPSALALPQRVAAELSARRRTRTFSRSGEGRAALLEDPPCLALQPALHRVADLLGRGGVRQADAQQPARHAWQAVGTALSSTAPVARASSTRITVSPRKGSSVPSRQSMRADCRRCARSRCSRSLRRIQPRLSCSALRLRARPPSAAR